MTPAAVIPIFWTERSRDKPILAAGNVLEGHERGRGEQVGGGSVIQVGADGMNQPLLRHGAGMARRGRFQGAELKAWVPAQLWVLHWLESPRWGSELAFGQLVGGGASHQNEGSGGEGAGWKAMCEGEQEGKTSWVCTLGSLRCPWQQQETGGEGLKLRRVWP